MTQSSMHLPPLRQGRRVWHTEAADTRRAECQPRPGPLLVEELRLRQLPREQPRFPWPGGTGSRQSSAWGAPRSAGARHGNPPLLSTLGDFPGSPVASTLCFHCWGAGSVPGQRTKILQAA